MISNLGREADAEKAIIKLGGEKGNGELEGSAAIDHASGVGVRGEFNAVKGGKERGLAGGRQGGMADVGGETCRRQRDGGVIMGKGDRGNDRKAVCVLLHDVAMRIKKMHVEKEFAATGSFAA